MTQSPFIHGVAGLGAREEHARRKKKREDRVQANHPILAPALLGLIDDPQTTKAWSKGAEGEEKLAKRLNPLASEKFVIFHDRKMPKSRANVDHMVLTSEALYIIDAKLYKGRPEKRTKGGLFTTKKEELWVNGRNQTKLVDGVHKQMTAALGTVGEEIPVRGVLCFIDADFPLFGGSFKVNNIDVLWPRKLIKLLNDSAKDSVSEALTIKILETFR